MIKFQSPLSRGTTPDGKRQVCYQQGHLVSIPSKSGHYSRHKCSGYEDASLPQFQSPLSRGTTPDTLTASKTTPPERFNPL